MGAILLSEIECVGSYAARTGESPTWSAHDQALYWIDIDQPALHRFDPASGRDTHWMMPDQIGCFALDAAASLALVGLRRGLYELSLGSGSLRPLVPAPFDSERFRFNEGGCDDRGRFWVGVVFEPRSGSKTSSGPERPARSAPWYSYLQHEGLRMHADLAMIPNGLAYSTDGRTLYLAHTQERRIYAFDYDARTGNLSDRRVFASIPDGLGVPDGGTIDADGCYWSALHGGGRLRRFTPDGEFDIDIELPVSCPTKCAFGGPDLDTLYVTSESGKLTDAERQREPWAGHLLRFRSSICGRLSSSVAWQPEAEQALGSVHQTPRQPKGT